jgi:hypothetical protein
VHLHRRRHANQVVGSLLVLQLLASPQRIVFLLPLRLFLNPLPRLYLCHLPLTLKKRHFVLGKRPSSSRRENVLRVFVASRKKSRKKKRRGSVKRQLVNREKLKRQRVRQSRNV